MFGKNSENFLIAVDIDGTLLNTEFDDVLSRREIEALQEVHESDNLLVLCTGRNLKSVEQLLSGSGWFPGDLPLVLLNGATVWGGHPRRCLAQRVLDSGKINKLVHLFRQFAVAPMIYGTDDGGGILYHESHRTNDILARYLEKRRQAVGAIQVTDDLLSLGLDEALEVGSIEQKQTILELTEAIRLEFADQVKVVNTCSLLGGGLYYWAEVFHAACGKAAGLAVIREHYPEIAGPLVAIGDNFNDLDMFAAADFSVAMGNSPAEVKQQANHVTESVSNGGAALVLLQLLEGQLPSATKR